MEELNFKTADGLNIFVRTWHPDGNPRGIIAIVPGFNSHSGYYSWAAENFVKNGYAVYAIDLRGRGKSDGERFYIKSFNDYVNDVAKMIEIAKSKEPGLPIVMLGHSAGGVVSCLYTLDHQKELAGLICESFAFRVPAPDFVLAVFKGFSHLAPYAHILHLKNEFFSRDKNFVAAMNIDPLIAHETQPTQTLAEMVRADEKLEKSFHNFTLPLLILHGTNDKATKYSGSQFFYDNAGSNDKKLRLYNGGYHDLLNDINRDAVMRDILDWVNERISVGMKSASVSAAVKH